MNPYLIGGGVAVLSVMGFLLKNSYERNGELEALLDTQVDQTQECVTANLTNDAAITELEVALDAMTAGRAADAAEREAVLVERSQELAAARALADRLERERQDEIDTIPECADLMALSIDAACPATTHQLRQRSIGISGDTDPDG